MKGVLVDLCSCIPSCSILFSIVVSQASGTVFREIVHNSDSFFSVVVSQCSVSSVIVCQCSVVY